MSEPIITTSKIGYLVCISDEQLATVYPVRGWSPEEQAADDAAAQERNRTYVEEIYARLATAHESLQPVIAHHWRDTYGECRGCDAGSYAESDPDWPCSTIELILEGLEPETTDREESTTSGPMNRQAGG